MARSQHRRWCFACPLLWAVSASAQVCNPSWNSRFTVTGVAPFANYQVVYDDDGPGPHAPALYLLVNWNTVTRWDGSSFTALPPIPSIEGQVYISQLYLYDPDGAGPALPSLVVTTSENVGGHDTNGSILRWDGAAWTRLVGPRAGYMIEAITGSDGAALPAGLYFSQRLANGSVAGGPSTIWRYDGVTTQLPGMFQGQMYMLSILDDDGPGPRGPSLILGGLSALARWDGTSWTGFGSGLLPNPAYPGSYSRCHAVVTFDPDGSGPERSYLYVGGDFYTAGGVTSPNLARWDGTNWSAVGAGGLVYALYPATEAGAAVLYAAGQFASVAGVAAGGVARLAAGQWSALGSGLTTDCLVASLAVFDDDGPGPKLPYLSLAGAIPSWINSVSGLPAYNLAKWDGARWVPWGQSLDAPSHAFATFDDGHGPALYASGEFSIAGGGYVHHIARWSGSAWEPLAHGLDGEVDALCAFDDGSGPALYAGGLFTSADNGAGPIPTPHLARWNGAQWSPIGADDAVLALLPYGGTLIAGGLFTEIGGVLAAGIASWNGAQWSPLSLDSDGGVHALCRHDDGNGPRLIAGGRFHRIGGVSANRIASWDGAAWSPLGAGTNNWVHTLASFREGSTPALFAGGRFTQAGEVIAIGIARWSQQTWSPVGAGMNNHVDALAVFDDGTGPALYAGGKFAHIAYGTEPLGALGRWDGAAWRPVQGGTDAYVDALTVADLDGPGGHPPALFVGGTFVHVGQIISPFIAELDGCASPCYANCDASTAAPILNVNDFICFLNKFAAADPYANCDASTTPPVLNVMDFNCFLNKFAAGCP